jgi:hypothetical protein
VVNPLNRGPRRGLSLEAGTLPKTTYLRIGPPACVYQSFVYETDFDGHAADPPVSEALLMEVSNAMARPLPFPEDYLDFLRQWNGAIGLECHS